MKLSELNSKKKLTLFYTAAFFTYLVLYNAVYVNKLGSWEITDITYTFHIVDFGLGVESGFVVGTIYQLFFKKLLPEQMAVYEGALIIAFFLFVSVCISKLICMERHTKKERTALTVAALFFVSGPCSFSAYTRTIGTLDVYQFYAVALFLLLLSGKKLKYFAPIAIVFALSVHMSAMLSVVVLFMFVLVYRLVESRDKKEQRENAVLLTVSVIVTMAAAVFFVVLANKTITYDLQGFCNELYRRGEVNGHRELVRPSYFTYKLYNDFTNDIWYFGKFYTEYPIEHYFPTLSKYIPEVAGDALSGVFNIINLHFKAMQSMKELFWQTIIKAVIVMLPIDCFLFGFWIYCAKRTESIIKKIMFIFMIFQMPVLFITSSMASLDWARWMIMGFIINFTCMLYVIYKNKEAIRYIEKVIDFFRLRCIIPYFVVYSSVVFYVYVL